MKHSTASSSGIIISTAYPPDGLYWLEMVSGHRTQLEKVMVMRY